MNFHVFYDYLINLNNFGENNIHIHNEQTKEERN